jgi:hypothetical protein
VGLIGDAPAILDRLDQLERAGIDAIMVKTEQPFEESERFARDVIGPYRTRAGLTPADRR